jgi:ribosomal protein S21
MKKWTENRNFDRGTSNENERHFTGSKVEVRNNDVNYALRKMKKILERNDFQKDLAKHEFYEKPGVKRKRAKEAAKKRWQKEVNKMRMAGVWQDRSSGDLKYMKSKRKRRKVLDRETMLTNLIRSRNKQ